MLPVDDGRHGQHGAVGVVDDRVDGGVVYDVRELAQVALLVRVRHLLSLANFPSSLRELGFEEADLGGLAQRASEQWTAGFNPRPIEASDFFRLYSSIFKHAPCFEETQGLS